MNFDDLRVVYENHSPKDVKRKKMSSPITKNSSSGVSSGSGSIEPLPRTSQQCSSSATNVARWIQSIPPFQDGNSNLNMNTSFAFHGMANADLKRNPPPPPAFSDPDRASQAPSDTSSQARRAICPVIPTKFTDFADQQGRSFPQPLLNPMMFSQGVLQFPIPKRRETGDLFDCSFMSIDKQITSEMMQNRICWTIGDQLCVDWDYAIQIYSSLLETDVSRSIAANLLRTQKMGVTEENRKEVVMNILRKRKQNNLSMETIHLAIFILDKCLDSLSISPSVLHNLGGVALVLASKMEEYSALRFSHIIKKELCTTDDPQILRALEMMVYDHLDFSLIFATSYAFIGYFHAVLNSSTEVITMAMFLLELSLISAEFRNFRTVQLAHACACLAHLLVSLRQNALYFDILCEVEVKLEPASRLRRGSSRPAMKALLSLLRHEIYEADCKTILMEYASSDNWFVTPPELFLLFDILPS